MKALFLTQGVRSEAAGFIRFCAESGIERGSIVVAVLPDFGDDAAHSPVDERVPAPVQAVTGELIDLRIPMHMAPPVEACDTERMAQGAVEFGRSHGVDVVWAVLDGLNVVRCAVPIARALDAPLCTQVPFDSGRSAAADALIPQTLAASRICIAGSRRMAQSIQRNFGVKADAFAGCWDRLIARRPAISVNRKDSLVIGVHNALAVRETFLALIRQLDRLGWRIGRRTVRFSLVGRPPIELADSRLTWIEPEDDREAIAALGSSADVIYSAGSFATEGDRSQRHAIPPALPVLLAAGRPIVHHAPLYDGVTDYLNGAQAGIVCGISDPEPVVNAISWLLHDRRAYAQLATQASAAFEHDFGDALVKSRLRAWLSGVSQDDRPPFGEPSS